MDKVICPNCGAVIYEDEPKCPFCGYINISGAEEKFMRDVQKTEDNLSEIPEIQKKHLKKSLSKSSKIVIVTIGIATVLALMAFGLHMLKEHILYGNFEYDVKAEMQWENENFPMLDEMLAEGRYEEILDFEYGLYAENKKNKTNHSIIKWEHYYFVSAYGNYATFKREIKQLDGDNEMSEFETEDMVYLGLWFYYRIYDSPYLKYTDEEFAQIEEYREEIVGDLFGRLKFTEEELLTLESEVVENDFLVLDACCKYAKKVKDRFE